MMEPLREKLLFRLVELVLEVGAGNGLNFPITARKGGKSRGH